MKKARKYFSLDKAKKILQLYKQFNTYLLPEIEKFNIECAKPYIDFLWVDGNPVDENNAEHAFFELGKFHRTNFIKEEKMGFSTLCHGDVHLGNIIEKEGRIQFIDISYINVGNNFEDLDYLDFFDWFGKETHPWMIKDVNHFKAYLDGAKIKVSGEDLVILKKRIAKNGLIKFINNGIENNINTGPEKKLLAKVSKDLSDLV